MAVLTCRAMLPLILSLVAYMCIVGPFSTYMQAKPIEEKLGFVPSVQVIKPMSGGFSELAAAGLVMKVTMYFGGLFVDNEKLIKRPPDYEGMSRLLQGAIALDPYNMDAYYFSQSFLVWDLNQVQLANRLLEKGMQFRSWDWYLPFFAGFNYAYFLKDYDKAAAYYKKAAEITGDSLFTRLASRYMHEAGQTELAIMYLEGMLATARGEVARQSFTTRLKAFKEVLEIESARDNFMGKKGRLPVTITELVEQGLLAKEPVDPYGGRFIIAADGKVGSTSKFAFGPSLSKDN